jgi:hypothetical protein
LLVGDAPVAGASQQINQNHVSLANQHGTHKFVTLPPLHIAGRAQFAVKANRRHAVVLHPVEEEAKKKKKKKSDFTQDVARGTNRGHCKHP